MPGVACATAPLLAIAELNSGGNHTGDRHGRGDAMAAPQAATTPLATIDQVFATASQLPCCLQEKLWNEPLKIRMAIVGATMSFTANRRDVHGNAHAMEAQLGVPQIRRLQEFTMCFGFHAAFNRDLLYGNYDSVYMVIIWAAFNLMEDRGLEMATSSPTDVGGTGSEWLVSPRAWANYPIL